MKSIWSEFILKYQEDVIRYCFFLSRNEKVAHDLAQDCFLKALSLNSLPDNPKAFLFRMAKNQFIDLKRKSNNDLIVQDALKDSPGSIEPSDLAVWQVLFSLDPDEQELLLLVDREGMSINEAADLLKLSEAALKSRLFRARENFKIKWNL